MNALTARLAGRHATTAPVGPASIIGLVRDRYNAHDRLAVRVTSDGQHVGYLERGLSRLVTPLLDRGRPVFGSPLPGSRGSISLFIPSRTDSVAPSLRATIFPVFDADARLLFYVDPKQKVCTCPDGRGPSCVHRATLTSRSSARLYIPSDSLGAALFPVTAAN